MNTQLINQITNVSNWDQSTRMQILMEAQQSVISGNQDEVAMAAFSALSPRNDTWRQFVNQFVAMYPQNPIAQMWSNYLKVFNSPRGNAAINQLINEMSAGNIPNHPPANIRPEEWAAVVDTVNRETGQTFSTNLDFTPQLVEYVRSLSTPQPSAPAAAPAGEPVYEMLWNCRFCGTEKLLGKSQKFCPICGAAQDPSWRYFPSDEEKVAVQDHRFVGADVECPACGTLNSGDSTYCTRCGSPLDAAEAVKVQSAREKHQSQKFETEDLQARIHREYDAEAGRIQPQAASGGRSGIPRWAIIGGVVAILAVCFGIIYVLFFASEERSVYVTGFEWERTIEIEQLRAVDENVRCENMPAGAYSVDRRREQVDTRRVQVGEDCRVRQVDQGDGTFREERVCDPVYENEPVYGDVCYYTINRWLDDRTLREEGTKDNEVIWPNVSLACTGERLGCEREGGRDENYVLLLAGDDDASYECEVDFDLWQNTRMETVFTIQVNTVTNQADCGSLEAGSSG